MATSKSLDAGIDSLDNFATLFLSKGRMPGYLGFVPGMRNHVVGKRYAEASLRASDCTDMLRKGVNPSGSADLVDDRPQGRQHLYAQLATPIQDSPTLAPPHVGKRKPYIDSAATGQIDPRLIPKVVGGTLENRAPMKTSKSVSMPKLPYENRRCYFRKEYPEKPPETGPTSGKIPGYTGFQAGAQHLFAQSYGRISNDLNANPNASPVQLSKQFMRYGEGRPNRQHFTYETTAIPGYQGHVPARDAYVYGKTYGHSAALARDARLALNEGKNPSCLAGMVDHRPTGRVDLYSESHITHHEANPQPLRMHMGKGVNQPVFRFTTNDYKIRERVEDDIKEVQQGRHKMVGYTGHLRGEQHLYAQSYGKMTRQLEDAREKDALDSLVEYKHDEPQKR